jgi:hypothetical protein
MLQAYQIQNAGGVSSVDWRVVNTNIMLIVGGGFAGNECAMGAPTMEWTPYRCAVRPTGWVRGEPGSDPMDGWARGLN